MTQYVAIIHKDAGSDYGVSFPDFPGCVTAGSTLAVARRMAEEALSFHVRGMMEDSEPVPEPSSLDVIMASSDFRDGVAVLVDLAHRPAKNGADQHHPAGRRLERRGSLCRGARPDPVGLSGPGGAAGDATGLILDQRPLNHDGASMGPRPGPESRVYHRLRPYIPTALFALLIFYFGYQALTGDRGLLTRPQRNAELAARTGELKRLQAQEAELTTRVRLLGDASLSRDLLDERAREILGFADPRDYVIRTPRRSD